MNATELRLDHSATQQEIAMVSDQLGVFNRAATGWPKGIPLNVLVRQADGTAVGGIEAGTAYGWLYVHDLWLPESCRRQGLGTRLMDAVEAEAVKRECKNAWLSTFSYQAKPFYLKRGYIEFAHLDDYPATNKLFFLRKQLNSFNVN